MLLASNQLWPCCVRVVVLNEPVSKAMIGPQTKLDPASSRALQLAHQLTHQLAYQSMIAPSGSIANQLRE